MEFTYDYIYKLYDTFFNCIIMSRTIILLKTLSISFFIIYVWSNLLQKFENNVGSNKLPFDAYKILQSLGMVFVIINYDSLLTYLDEFLFHFDKIFAEFSPSVEAKPTQEEIDLMTEIKTDKDLTTYMKEIASAGLNAFMSPMVMFSSFLEMLFNFIDKCIYGLFLIERFFFIGLLRILGAIVITLGVFDKFRDMFYKWLKVYFSVFFMIIPFYMVMGFANYVIRSPEINAGGDPLELSLSQPNKLVLIVICVCLKYSILKKSNQLLTRVFS